MATSITIAARPLALDGCWHQWSEKEEEATIRSDMELGGFTKVRLRTTDAGRTINAIVRLEANLYQTFMDWYRVACVRGVFPTRVKQPDGTEIVARFTAAPAIEWPPIDKAYFSATCVLEQLPAWRDL